MNSLKKIEVRDREIELLQIGRSITLATKTLERLERSNIVLGERIFLIHNIQRESFSGMYEYPVRVKSVNHFTGNVQVETDYRFGFHDVIKMITLGAEVKRECWSKTSIKWIDGDQRGFLWCNTGDGYLPWLASIEDCRAMDWGVKYGYRHNNNISV